MTEAYRPALRLPLCSSPCMDIESLCFVEFWCWYLFRQQAKTTKKIVLRLQCQACKHVSQHAIKVISHATLFLTVIFLPCHFKCSNVFWYCQWFTEVQALWDWRRQEGKGNISVLRASLCSFRKILRCVLFLELIRHCGIILFDLFCSRLCCDEVWSRCGKIDYDVNQHLLHDEMDPVISWVRASKGKIAVVVWKVPANLESAKPFKSAC